MGMAMANTLLELQLVEDGFPKQICDVDALIVSQQNDLNVLIPQICIAFVSGLNLVIFNIMRKTFIFIKIIPDQI